MALNIEEVRRLAALARLDLSEAESGKLGGELERILDYVKRLAEVDTKGIPETEGAGEARPLRVDEPVPAEAATRELIIGNFPDKTGGALRVPAVFENPKG